MSNALAFVNATVFDGRDLLEGPRTVVIEGERVVTVSKQVQLSNDVDCTDLAGKTLMPGLIDAHFHCNSPDPDVARADRLPASLVAQYARRFIESALHRGFTTVRDAGGADSGIVTAIEQGLIDGPRLYVSGLALSQTGGHGDFSHREAFCPCQQYSGHIACVVDGVDNVRRKVREQLRNGARQVKMFISGGVLSPTDPIWMDQFTDEEILAAVHEAARWRTYVMAHALSASSVRRCIALGVRSIEHGLQIDSETADALARSACFVVPTLSIYNALATGRISIPEWARAKARGADEEAVQSLRRCVAAGVKLGFGTDLIGDLHGLESQELLLRGAVGGSLQTLRSATSVNAEMMNLADSIGTVREGAYADLLIVDGNPVNDISLLANPNRGLVAVMKGGRWIRNSL